MSNAGFVGFLSLPGASELHKLLADNFSAGSFYVLVGEREHSEIKKGLPPLEELKKCDSGRCFDERLELRWNSDCDGKLSVIALADSKEPVKGEFADSSGTWSTRALKLALVGQPAKERGSVWRDTRYPREFHHPVSGGRRAFVQAVEYCDESTGREQYIRWTGVIV